MKHSKEYEDVLRLLAKYRQKAEGQNLPAVARTVAGWERKAAGKEDKEA